MGPLPRLKSIALLPAMISNQRPSPHGRRLARAPKSIVPEETLKTGQAQIERKTFTFHLKENALGRFLRIIEDVGGRKDTIIVPATGLEEFQRLLREMQKTSDATPPKTPEGGVGS